MSEITIKDFKNPAGLPRTVLSKNGKRLTEEEIKGLFLIGEEQGIKFTDEEKTTIRKTANPENDIFVTKEARSKIETIIEIYNEMKEKPNLGNIYRKYLEDFDKVAQNNIKKMHEEQEKSKEDRELDKMVKERIKYFESLAETNQLNNKKITPEKRREKGDKNREENKDNVGTKDVKLKENDTLGVIYVDPKKINALKTNTYKREGYSTKRSDFTPQKMSTNRTKNLGSLETNRPKQSI